MKNVANQHWSQKVTPTAGLRPLRMQARRFLTEHRVAAGRIDDVILTLSELASNALAAADGPNAVVIAELDLVNPSTLKVAVTNTPSTVRLAAMQVRATDMPQPQVDHGRGLPLVALLASRVTIQNEDDSTTVTAEFLI